MNHPPLSSLTVSVTAPLQQALESIDTTGRGVCFVVDEHDVLKGILTDGDVRRAILKGGYTPDTAVELVMNRDFVSLSLDADNATLLRTLNDRVRTIPLVDAEGRVRDYATAGKLRRIPVASPLLNGNELTYVMDCITSTWVSSQGEYINRFQTIFQETFGQPVALAVSNGTVAIHLALEALGIGKGDEVIVPDFTFAATINAVLYTGATPVLADVDRETWTLDPEAVRQLITPRTKAILPVHLYGHPCRMTELMALAEEHGLWVVEDCAEAIGSLCRGQPIGSFGHAATFSFFGNKTITTGEGGMVLFRDAEVGERAKMLRDHGMSPTKRYWHEAVGFNYRMTNMQAALGVAQMERLDEFVDRKRAIAQRYNAALKDVPHVTLPPECEWAHSSYWLYTFLLDPASGKERSRFLSAMLGEGVECRPTFYPLHEMPIYSGYGDATKLTNSKWLSSCGVSLPSSVSLSEAEQDVVADAVRRML